MTYRQHIFLTTIALSVLSACSPKEQPPAEPPPVKDTVFGDMVKAEDKARAVQGTVNAQKEELDKQVQAAEEQHE